MEITPRIAHTTIHNSKRSGVQAVSVQAVNDGKWSEIKERVRHGVERGQLGRASYAESHPE